MKIRSNWPGISNDAFAYNEIPIQLFGVISQCSVWRFVLIMLQLWNEFPPIWTPYQRHVVRPLSCSHHIGWNFHGNMRPMEGLHRANELKKRSRKGKLPTDFIKIFLFSFYLKWNLSWISMLDLQVLPLGLAEAINQEDPRSFATSFSSLVRISEGSKASFLLNLMWRNLVSVLSDQQENSLWQWEASASRDGVSVPEMDPEQTLLFALAWYYML